MVKELIENEADLNARNDNQDTALIVACESGKKEGDPGITKVTN